MSNTSRYYPLFEEFAIGSIAGVAAADLPPIVRVRDIGLVTAIFTNFGTTPITLSFTKADADADDNTLDETSEVAVAIRSAGSDVADITVVPGGKVEFAIEEGQLDKEFLRINHPNAGQGVLLLSFGTGELIRQRG